MEGDYNSQAQESEFDTIARYRGAAQSKMGALLAQHRHGNIHHGGKDEDTKGLEGKTAELSLGDKNDPQSGVSEQLHNSSDEARERVFQANDRTYDAINEAKEAVKKNFDEGRANEAAKDESNTSPDDSTYAAINKAKEELKDKFDAVNEKSSEESEHSEDETSKQAKDDKTSQVTDVVGKKYEETRDAAGQALGTAKEKAQEAAASTGNADGNEGKGAIQSATEKLSQVTQAIKEAIAGKGDGSPSA